MSEYHMMNDIRLRVGNTQQPVFKGSNVDLEKNEEFRINLFVRGFDGEKHSIPWKKCDEQEEDTSLTVLYCPDFMSTPPI